MEEITSNIKLARIQEMAERMFGNLVKGVVDVDRGRLVVDMDLHVDGEQHLLETGSDQANLWGINLHPDAFGSRGFVEFDSIVNIRPRANNRSRGVESPDLQAKIVELVRSKVVE